MAAFFRRIKNQYLINLSDGSAILILVFFLVGALFGSVLSQDQIADGSWSKWWSIFWQNVSAELLGVILTFVLIGILVDTRSRRAELIREVGSRDSFVVLAATLDLRVGGWLEDGSLKKVVLTKANLENTWLEGADLKEAVLFKANLEGADLRFANLEGGKLYRANLKEAWLKGTNLEGAELRCLRLCRNRK